MGKGLAELLRYYLGPTGIPERLGAANSMFNPVDGVGQSMAASRTLFAPETTPMGRVEATGNMLSGMAGVVAPAVVASRAGVPAANALVDTMTGLNTGAKSMGRAVVDRAMQPGPMPMVGSNGGNLFQAAPMKAPETPAQEVATMLATGRAAEVTDDMMARVDPQEMWRLYEGGATGMDMPMDAASRMGRAKGMGFDTGTPLYHGSKVDFEAFDPEKIAPHNARGRGFYMTDSTESAGGYAGGADMNRIDLNVGDQQNVAPLLAGGKIMDERKVLTPAEVSQISDSFAPGHFDYAYPANGSNVLQEFSYRPDEQNAALRGAGYSGRIGPGIVGGRDAIVFDPRNIRSQFARFDPRLRHLANLNAGIAGLFGVAGLGAAMQPGQAQAAQ